jgi:hypothetical protein
MNQIHKLVAGLLVSVAFLLTNCGKDTTTIITNPPNPPNPTPTEVKTALLVGKSWVLTGYTLALGSAAATDQYSTVAACKKDNSAKFTADGKYSEDEGATKCNASDPQIAESGTWLFSNSLTAITVRPTGQPFKVAHLVELTAKTLKVYNNSYTFNGVNYVYTYTYTAK